MGKLSFYNYESQFLQSLEIQLLLKYPLELQMLNGFNQYHIQVTVLQQI